MSPVRSSQLCMRASDTPSHGIGGWSKGMPIYEYQCDSCDRRFEVMQRMTESPLATCDECGGPVRRLISQTSFVLKGSGWYVTDYPSESRKKAMSQEKNGGGSPSSSSKPAETTTASTAPEKVSSSTSDT
jgi:putative FmdB family regulatory protein